MSIGLISDTHGSLSAWKSSMAHGLADCNLIIHCGDLLYHGPRNPLPDDHNPKVLAESINELSIPIHICKGNCDASIDQVLIDCPIQDPAVVVRIGRFSIFAHHGHAVSDADLDRFCKMSKINVVVSGHTHVRHFSNENGILIINPGSCALPKTEDNRPSFALLDDNVLKFIDVKNGTALEEYAIEV
jgi:putative phosphoesterase